MLTGNHDNYRNCIMPAQNFLIFIYEMMMQIVITKLKIPPSKKREILQTIHALSEMILKRGGCHSYKIYKEIGSENDYCFVEEWDSVEELRGYFNSELCKVLVGAMSLLDNPPTIISSKVTQIEEAERLTQDIYEKLLAKLNLEALEERNGSFQEKED